MSDPVVAGKSPIEVQLQPGKYWWCACGLSKKQPFCDGSHTGTGIDPLPFNVETVGPQWLCTCKHSANPPFCDGAHDLLD